MRIAFVFDAMLYGGIERVGLDYIRLLREMHHEITVFIMNPHEVEPIVNMIPPDCTIIKRNIPSYICPERYWYIAKRWWWGKYVFPFVHLILRSFLEVYKVTFRYKKFDLAIAFAGHFSDLSFIAYNFIRSQKKACWLHGGLYSYMIISPGYERLYRKIKNLVVLNDWGQNECLFYNKYLIQKLNITKIYNPCFIKERDVNMDKVTYLKEQYGDFILMVARVDLPKNHKSLLRALKFLKGNFGLSINVVFVGDGSLKDELRTYASSLGVEVNCFFEGTQADTQSYYMAARLFVLTSFSEGLPTVLIEAAAFGLPIVASDSSVREILGNNEYGIICPIDNHVALAEAIHALWTNSGLYTKYAKAASDRFEQFTPYTISEQLECFLKNLK